VTRDGGRPGRQAAGARVRAARQREHDLLERGLDEIVVVVLAAAEHPVEGAIDDPEEPVVKLARDELVAALHGIDDLLVGRRA
jgi:hypothetical protein